MDQDFAADGVVDKRALKALAQRSDSKGLGQLAGHLALLAITGSIVQVTWPSAAVVPAMVVHGLVLIFLFAPLHECIHWTAFKSRAINDAVAAICGFLLMLPAKYFRHFHFAHHRHTQDPSKDPELAVPKPRTLTRYLIYVSGWLYWSQRTMAILRHAAGRVDEPFIPEGQRPAIVREARFHLLLYVLLGLGSWQLGSWALAIYWVLPALLGQPFLRLYLLAEHGGCPEVADMFKNTRTTLTNALVRRLAWNMPYHTEHHAFPAVPFHALPQAHQVLRERIAVMAPGYIAVHRELVAALSRSGSASATAS